MSKPRTVAQCQAAAKNIIENFPMERSSNDDKSYHGSMDLNNSKNHGSMGQQPKFEAIDNDPLFKMAIKWGIFPQAVTKLINSYGANAVKKEILFTSQYKKAACRARFLYGRLRKNY